MSHYQYQKKYKNRIIKKHNNKFFKKKYFITFYDKDDEQLISTFNNLKEICAYKNKDINYYNIRLLNIELINALKRKDHYTRMLDGTPMHVYLIDIDEEDLEDDI